MLDLVVGRRRVRERNVQTCSPPVWVHYRGALLSGPQGHRESHWECLHRHRTEAAAYECARAALKAVRGA